MKLHWIKMGFKSKCFLSLQGKHDVGEAYREEEGGSPSDIRQRAARIVNHHQKLEARMNAFLRLQREYQTGNIFTSDF